MSKLTKQGTKQGQERHKTNDLKGWINLFDSKDVLRIDKGAANQTETHQNIALFLQSHESKDLLIVSTDYLQAHRRSIKAYYSKMGSMFKNFALPLVSFYYVMLYEQLKALNINTSDFFFSPSYLRTFIAGVK